MGKPVSQPVVQMPDGSGLGQGFGGGDKDILWTQHIFQGQTQDSCKQQVSPLGQP